MMKYARNLVWFSLLTCIWACQSKQAEQQEWPAMDDFHMVMAEAYHPFKDSANLEPARRLAPELARMGFTWAESTLPERMNTEEVRKKLNSIAAHCQSITEKVNAHASDQELGSELTDLHEEFHSIMEAWHQAGKEEHK